MTAGCRIGVRRRSKEKRAIGKAVGTSVESDCPDSAAAAAAAAVVVVAAAAVDCFVVEKSRSSGIEGSQRRRVNQAERGSRAGVGMGAKE